MTPRPARPQAREPRRDWVRLAPLLTLFLVACAVGQPGPEPVRDEPALLAATERLVEDSQLAAPGPDPDQRAFLWHGPGLVVVLAPLVAIDLPLTAIRFISPLLLGLAVVLFHRLLLTYLRPRQALLGTYALGLYLPFLAVVGTIQKEPLAILLVVAAMLALARASTSRRAAPLVGAGLALGALAMVRLEYGWVAMALLAIAVVMRRRHLAIAAAIAVLACVPWLLYTYTATDRPLYWGASSGLSLFWMSPTLPGETGQWHSPVRVHRDPALAPYRPLFRHLDEVHPLVSDRTLHRLAVQNITDRPLAYVRNLAANVGRLLFAAPMRPWRPTTTAILVLCNGLLLVAVAWAVVAARSRSRVRLPPEVAPFMVFAALAIAVHLPPSASPRMLFPVVPVLVWFVAVTAAAHRGEGHRSAAVRSRGRRRPVVQMAGAS